MNEIIAPASKVDTDKIIKRLWITQTNDIHCQIIWILVSKQYRRLLKDTLSTGVFVCLPLFCTCKRLVGLFFLASVTSIHALCNPNPEVRRETEERINWNWPTSKAKIGPSADTRYLWVSAALSVVPPVPSEEIHPYYRIIPFELTKHCNFEFSKKKNVTIALHWLW